MKCEISKENRKKVMGIVKSSVKYGKLISESKVMRFRPIENSDVIDQKKIIKNLRRKLMKSFQNLGKVEFHKGREHTSLIINFV